MKIKKINEIIDEALKSCDLQKEFSDWYMLQNEEYNDFAKGLKLYMETWIANRLIEIKKELN